ncbi:helix-turn-helix domain-containing protein [Lachnospiraceae bacterium LCP19S3_B12]
MFSYKKYAELLAKNNISSYKVSKDTGLYSPLFSEWKSGKSVPKVDKIKIIADYFDVSIEYFLEGEPAKEVV